jgi:hypothetical protein
MTRVLASGVRGRLTRTAVAAAIAGLAVMGATVPANADPGCDTFGWRHPLCAGGAWESPPADDGIPGDNAAEGGIPAPAMVPNIDGSLSLPGTPGAV